jgi:hypothetical protein
MALRLLQKYVLIQCENNLKLYWWRIFDSVGFMSDCQKWH